jgi:molybdopterin molybdotransferase
MKKGLLTMMHFDESMKILHAQAPSMRRTKRLYIEDALGYVLAEDIVADHNSPEYPTSGMDGYAIKHEDQVLGRLRIAAINPAGSDKRFEVIGGTCVKTFTGSLMPEGSDTLIPIENVEVEGEEIVIKEEVPKGFSVREIGENYARGDVLIKAGTKLDFSHIGVLAGLNVVHVTVYEKPRTAILATGSELLELGQLQTAPSQIRSSNNYTIEAIVRKYGGEPLQMGCVGDDKESILETMRRATASADIVVTTGGVSVGDFDFVKDVVYELGFDVLFKGVRIKPGQHIMLARKEDTFIVALPGFAYSSTVTALLYVLPLIAAFQAQSDPLKRVRATLKEPFTKRAKKAEFTACNVYLEDGRYVVDFKGKKVGTSAIMTNMLGPVGLLYTTEEESSKAAGEEVTVVLLD